VTHSDITDKMDHSYRLYQFAHAVIFAVMFLCVVPILLEPAVASGQSLSITAGLGFEYFDPPGLSQYLNFAAPGSMTPGTYTTAAQFKFGAEYPISDAWSIGVELGYITKSTTGSDVLASEQVDYSYTLPSLTLRRYITGDGYYIRFGGGIGYHFASLSASNPYSLSPTNYSAHGLGFDFDAELDTKLSEHLYARIGGDARSEYTGILRESDGTELNYYDSNNNGHAVTMYMSGIGVIFALVYYF